MRQGYGAAEMRAALLVIALTACDVGSVPSRPTPAGSEPAVHVYVASALPVLTRAGGEPALAPVTKPAPGAAPLFEGGMSALASTGAELWTITDRGPNVDVSGLAVPGGGAFPKHTKFFPLPAYNQAILRLAAADDGSFSVVERLGVTRAGQPTNGLPSNRPGRTTREHAFGPELRADPGAELAPSPLGYDFEGIGLDVGPGGQRTYWVADEYGPSIARLDAQGRMVAEWVPGVPPSGEGTTGDPSVAPLPAVLRQRRDNRGFEGLAVTRESVFAIVESTLAPDGGASGEHGHGNEHTRLHRLVRLDKTSGAVTMFAYEHDADIERIGLRHGDVRIGDLTALGPDGSSLLVYEHDAHKHHARFFRVRLDGATPLDPAAGAAYEAGGASYAPVRKELVYDFAPVLARLPTPAKCEGVAVSGARTLWLVFDNDYGLTDDEGIRMRDDVTVRSLLVRVDFPGAALAP